MDNCLGIIDSGIQYNTYNTLCATRPDYMLPFGGRYRIVDFALSTMTNHGITQVGLYGGRYLKSTLDHIGDGQAWELNRKNEGVQIFQSYSTPRDPMTSEVYTYYQTLPFYEESPQDYIYFENPMYISNLKLYAPYQEFLDNDYDVLLFYKKQDDPQGDYLNTNKLVLDSEGNFKSMGVNLGTEDNFNMYLEKFFMKKNVFINLVKSTIEEGSATDINRVMVNNLDNLKIGLYEVDDHVEHINNTSSYYKSNMNLLDEKIYNEIFFGNQMIYTKSKDEPSAFYHEGSNVKNSLVANGCVIEGQVENSILFRGVKVGKNAIVRNSILMQQSEVGDDSIVVNTIADKYGVIKDNVTVIGNQKQPYIVEKSQIISEG